MDIYGSGPLVDTVNEYSTRTQVNFKGFLYSQKKYDVMSDGSVLLFPSQCIEGHPLLIEEAKVVGMPGLISNIGPLSEYTVGTNLRLIDFTVDDLRNTLSDYHHEISK